MASFTFAADLTLLFAFKLLPLLLPSLLLSSLLLSFCCCSCCYHSCCCCCSGHEASAAITPADSLPGNKVDRDDREIPEDVGAEFSQRHGMYFLETSAKASDNVEKLFGDIANELLQVNREKNHFPPMISLWFVLERNLSKFGATEKAPWFQIVDLIIHTHFFNYLRMPFFQQSRSRELPRSGTEDGGPSSLGGLGGLTGASTAVGGQRCCGGAGAGGATGAATRKAQ